MMPCLPAGPGGPMMPRGPALPVLPFCPLRPRTPWGPGRPGGPGGPGTHTAPLPAHWSSSCWNFFASSCFMECVTFVESLESRRKRALVSFASTISISGLCARGFSARGSVSGVTAANQTLMFVNAATFSLKVSCSSKEVND